MLLLLSGTVILLESGVIAAFLLIPERGNWKIRTGGILLAAALFLNGYLLTVFYLEKTCGYARNFEACNLAEEYIQAGKRDRLAAALKRDWWNEFAHRRFDETAAAFLEAIQNAETEK